MDDFIFACEQGDLNRVKKFIENGLDPTLQNNKAIIIASMYGELDIVKYLISKGADPQAKDNEPINVASINENIKVIRYLVSIGANWKKCSWTYQEILKAEQVQKTFFRKKFINKCRNLIPVYFSPNYTGGKLAKKDLSNWLRQNSLHLNIAGL